MLKLSHAKPFHSTLKYACTSNIEEVMKLYNPGDKLLKQTLILTSVQISEFYLVCGIVLS